MESQLRNHVRLALVKLREYNSLGEQHEQELRRVLTPTDSIDCTVAKLLQCEPRNDYQQLILMTFISELVAVLQSAGQPHSSQLPSKLDALLFEYLWPLLDREPTNREITSFYHLKKMEILRQLLCHKLQGETPLPTYERLYRYLKQCQEGLTNINREHFKVTFVSAHRSIIDNCHSDLLMEFVVGELLDDSLKALEENGKNGFEWMRTVDTRFLALHYLVTHRKLQPLLLYKIVFLVVKASAVRNIYVHVLALGIFEALAVALENSSRSPLLYILVTHMIVGPLNRQLQQADDIMFVELLLSQVLLLFRNHKLLFGVLRASDTNFHSRGIVYELVTRLYNYIETEEKKLVRSPIYELIKKTVKAIMDSVRELLQRRTESDRSLPSELESKLRFYRLKQKEYQAMVATFNQSKKPIELAGSGTNDYHLEHFVRFLKRSPHINAQKMIDVLGLNTPISKTLLKKYMDSFRLEGYPVEQALRIVLSNFFLIGESQQINRVIEELTLHISQTYKQRDWDSIYLQATTILMLNTDLHNPMNERKMVEQDWLKIALNVKGVTEAEAQPIYASVLHSKIECFRDYGNLHNMNLSCFLYNFYTESRCWTLHYIDPELKEFEEIPELSRYLSYEVLEGVLVGKEVDKILKLVDVFVYKDDVYECEILETLRVLVERGKTETPWNIYSVASKKVNFANDEIDEKYLSYYWLCAKIIGQQAKHISTDTICDFLLATVRTRKHLQDDLYCRTQLKVRRVKEALKEHKSRLLKKTGSLLDIFSNFLGQKESSEDEFKPAPRSAEPRKSIAFRKLALDIHDQLVADEQMRTRAIIHIMAYLRNPQNKLPIESFIAVLFLLFDLVYLSSDRACFELVVPLFEEILQEGESSLSQRLIELKRKKEKKHQLIYTLTQYYLLRILLEYFREASSHRRLAQCAVEFLDKCNPTVLQEIVAALEGIKESADEEESLFLRDVNRAVARSCSANNIVEGSVRNYVIGVLLRQDCRAIVNKIIDEIGDCISTVSDVQKKPSQEQPTQSEKTGAIAELPGKKEQKVVEEEKKHQQQEAIPSEPSGGVSEVTEATTSEPAPEIVRGDLIESNLEKSELERMEEALKKEQHSPAKELVVESGQQEATVNGRVQHAQQETEMLPEVISTDHTDEARRMNNQETQGDVQSIQAPPPQEPTSDKPIVPMPNEFTEHQPTQEEILQMERQYFAKLIGEHGEENLSELGLPLYML